MKPETVAGTILVMTEVPNLYSGLLPSMFTISSPFFHEQEAYEGNVKRIRQGEAIATGMAIAIGVAASKLFDSWLPLFGTLAMIGILLAAYEYALRNPASEDAYEWGSRP
jgi:hypothetical protein